MSARLCQYYISRIFFSFSLSAVLFFILVFASRAVCVCACAPRSRTKCANCVYVLFKCLLNLMYARVTARTYKE